MTETDQMLTSILKCRPVDLIARKGLLTTQQKSRYTQMKAQRASGHPLQYIIGHCDFMGTMLLVDDRVLIPRPETEILVDFVIKQTKSKSLTDPINVLDLGTGSGNIAITLAKHLKNSSVTAVDVSQEALVLANENARANEVASQITFVCEDMIVYLKKTAERGVKFDLIISNPPYIPTAHIDTLPFDVRWEPRLALDGGEDGLRFYRSIAFYGYRLLSSIGSLCFEIGDDQMKAITEIFQQFSQYQDLCFHTDYVGTDRFGVVHRVDSFSQK